MVNIFYLDDNLQVNCAYYADKHVVKMVIESCQLLSAICRVHGQSEEEAPYGIHSLKHPCALWAGASLSNWRWLRELTLELNKEYMFRYNKSEDHKSAAICKTLKEPEGLIDVGITERPQSMPDEYKVKNDPVQAYRNYYIGEKQYFCKWTKRDVPEWYKEGCKAWNLIHPDTPQTRQQHKDREERRKVERAEERKRIREEKKKEKEKEKEKIKAEKEKGKGKGKGKGKVKEKEEEEEEEKEEDEDEEMPEVKVKKEKKEQKVKKIVKRKRDSSLSSSSSSSSPETSEREKKKKKKN
eukprot:CAMPEP_0201523450 /NCGR_PEP_ID=MMETSP0161_2-20130828/19904_1 /ASSEMBLY_ACC=CAM_ASM_000251 /TAXON_ID=180227 /ORGANISM="Neoparamoeba aestuarina, Strain SoJaBio B1-5/56/2" /LENGTH=296 /DNA_ID=CAMNT_0047922565 /DNA_START=105 /DNA_END=995 /DNA_ORIENTATION=+